MRLVKDAPDGSWLLDRDDRVCLGRWRRKDGIIFAGVKWMVWVGGVVAVFCSSLDNSKV